MPDDPKAPWRARLAELEATNTRLQREVRDAAAERRGRMPLKEELARVDAENARLRKAALLAAERLFFAGSYLMAAYGWPDVGALAFETARGVKAALGITEPIANENMPGVTHPESAPASDDAAFRPLATEELRIRLGDVHKMLDEADLALKRLEEKTGVRMSEPAGGPEQDRGAAALRPADSAHEGCIDCGGDAGPPQDDR